jgi:hypothetical protein
MFFNLKTAQYVAEQRAALFWLCLFEVNEEDRLSRSASCVCVYVYRIRIVIGLTGELTVITVSEELLQTPTCEQPTLAATTMRSLFLAISAITSILWRASSFVVPSPPTRRQSEVRANNQNNDNKVPNIFQGIGDMLSKMDDVIDDFMSKRMGNGELFYGQRKFKPSGRPNTEGKYNGMGKSDRLKIDAKREVKEAIIERKRRQLDNRTKQSTGNDKQG